MNTRLFDSSLFETSEDALAFITSILESSIEYSLIGIDLQGTIVLWNAGARRVYGYEPNEVIGKANVSILYSHADRETGVPRQMLDATLRDGKWEDMALRRRKNGQLFTARLAITPRYDEAGRLVGFLFIAKDISDELRLTEQLKATQFYSRSLIESNIDALMTTDPLGVITDVSNQMTELTGCSREQLIGSPFKNYFTDQARAEQAIKLVLRDGRVTNYELMALSRDGQMTTVSYNASTFRDAVGRLQGVFAAARDITEQKKLESQLRESQAYNRGLIEASVDGLITVDPSGVILDVNEQMCRMTGCSREELIGTPFAEYFADASLAADSVSQAFQNGVVMDRVLALVGRDGRKLKVSFSASVFQNPAGVVRGIFGSTRDISDRERLEGQLREQQAYLRGLIESSVDGLVTIDPQGIITDLNEHMCCIVGLPRDWLVGSPFKNYFADQEAADAAIRRAFSEGVITNYALVLKSDDGRRMTISLSASAYRGMEGYVQGIFASTRDISEQARLQEELAEQQAYNRSLIEASADALFAIARDGTITDVNAEAARLTAHSRKHLINSRFADHFTEPDAAQRSVEQTLREKRVLGQELTLVTRHGRKIAVSCNCSTFADAQGQLLGVLAGVRDVTDQKQLECQLRDQQSYARSLIESNVDALMTTDPLGLITDVNQQMVILTGITREELIGSPFKNYFTDPERAQQGIRQVLTEGNVTDYELTARAKGGAETVVSYNAVTLFDRDHKLLGVFAAARDITDRKRFERTLQERTAEMERANLAKDRFLASMSHELRTPLNSVIGFTGTLLMGLAGPLTAEQKKQLETIKSSAKHQLSLINDLLNLAKIESGKVELKFELVDGRDIVEEVAQTLKPLADEKGLKLEVQVPNETLIVETDRRSLSQIVINLANNAIKFTDEGTVKIEARRNNDATEVSVVDTGIGIKPEDQGKLFEPFARVDCGTRRRQEGTGLGLHVSQKLAHLLGGVIVFTSAPGEGSTFTLSIP